MLTTSRSLTISVLVILLLLALFQGIPFPQLQLSSVTHPPNLDNATRLFVGETATDMLDQKGSRIYRAHGVEDGATANANGLTDETYELRIRAYEHQTVLQKDSQVGEEPSNEEAPKEQQEKAEPAKQKADTEEPGEGGGEEQEGDWHNKQVEAAKAVAERKEKTETQVEDWHQTQVTRAKEVAEKHG